MTGLYSSRVAEVNCSLALLVSNVNSQIICRNLVLQPEVSSVNICQNKVSIVIDYNITNIASLNFL